MELRARHINIPVPKADKRKTLTFLKQIEDYNIKGQFCRGYPGGCYPSLIFSGNPEFLEYPATPESDKP